MDVAARSIVPDATNLREVAAALRALSASKGDGTDRAFATNLEEIALEIDAAVKRSGAERDSRSLCVTARRLRWLAWSCHGDAPTTVMLIRLAKEMEDGAERLTVGARNLLPALAVSVALAIAVAAWVLDSPFVPRTAETAKAVPVPPPAPPTIMAAPERPEPPIARTVQPEIAAPPTIVAAPAEAERPIARAVQPEIAAPPTIAAAPAQPEPPIAQTVQPEIAAPSGPTASVVPPTPLPVAEAPPRPSGTVAEPKSIAKSEATTPKPASADETRTQITRFLDTVLPGSNVLSSAPPAIGAAAPKRVAKPKAASAQTSRAERLAPAGEARAQITRFPDTVVPSSDVLPSAPPAADAPPTIGATAVEGGAAAPVPLGATVSPGSRECVPYLADTRLSERSEPVLGLACRDGQGQWRRMSETPRQ
jgi:hypothetical protein